MIPSAIFAPCARCGVFPGAREGYTCLCHQRPGDPAYDRAVAAGIVRDCPTREVFGLVVDALRGRVA